MCSAPVTSAPSCAITITLAPRAFTSCTLLSIFSSSPCSCPTGRMAITGVPSSINAIGPCFSSPPANPSACIYANSFNLSAPSRATGNPTLRPRKSTDVDCANPRVSSRNGSTVSRICSIFPGNSAISLNISLTSRSLITPRSWAR
ncbi:unannotated protein [freshwater metagenome]|uniref:Unannotated protein n=1 Tax=freshwater metagenome TaxID=449393 RepID=A0A6J6PUJ9_9ZZZZ